MYSSYSVPGSARSLLCVISQCTFISLSTEFLVLLAYNPPNSTSLTWDYISELSSFYFSPLSFCSSPTGLLVHLTSQTFSHIGDITLAIPSHWNALCPDVWMLSRNYSLSSPNISLTKKDFHGQSSPVHHSLILCVPPSISFLCLCFFIAPDLSTSSLPPSKLWKAGNLFFSTIDPHRA